MKTADEIIRDANRISEFLRDPVIEAAMSGMERSVYEEFLAADSSEARVRAWAKATVLREFENELRKINGAAEKVQKELLNAAKYPAKSVDWQ